MCTKQKNTVVAAIQNCHLLLQTLDLCRDVQNQTLFLAEYRGL